MLFESLRDDRGWTLIELTVVAMIIGILTAIAVVSYTMTSGRARRIACQSNQRTLNEAVMDYESSHDGSMPPDLAALSDSIRAATYDRCPADTGVVLNFDATSGLVTCPIHPPQ